MNKQTSKVAVVTGAGRGIGAATVQRLSRDGWRVAAADLDDAAANAVAGQASGIGVACDVGSEADLHRLIEAVVGAYGRIDAIVSNAGINVRGPLASLTLESWNRVLAVNLTAAFLLARAAEQALRSAHGAMVLIASTRAHMSEPDTLPYSASKGGLVALTHALAITLAPEVRVNCISPGWIDTGKWGALGPADHAQHPAGRVGRPEDVAGAVAYLLSEDAGFITGAEFILDGGMTRKMIYV
jgi:NAD(P)-dependent dehydrogenase (short-subunit alcohol dehydrogenase family)